MFVWSDRSIWVECIYDPCIFRSIHIRLDFFIQNMPVKYELIVISHFFSYFPCPPLHKKMRNETNRHIYIYILGDAAVIDDWIKQLLKEKGGRTLLCPALYTQRHGECGQCPQLKVPVQARVITVCVHQALLLHKAKPRRLLDNTQNSVCSSRKY